jgi:multiple sugar transport system ATP-binding protein
MGRAMVREPVAFLMDEPLSNLDAKLRVEMRAELARLRDRLKTTTLYVTHDQVEAMTLGDRVAVLKDGVLQQVDTPQRLFNEPTNLFVAAFIGSPSMNLVDARVEDGVVHFGPYAIALPPDRQHLNEYADRRLVLGIRPHDFEDAEVWKSDLPTMEVKADVTEELGSEVHVIFTVDAPPVVTEQTMAAGEPDEGDFVPLVEAEGKTSFTARVDPRTRCRPGSMVRLTVDPGRFHFFERDSGKAIGAPSALVASGSDR